MARPDLPRGILGGLGLLAVAGVAAALWAALAPLPSGPRELVYVIPRGTASRQGTGADPRVLPSRIRLTLGVQDVLVLKNEDDVRQSFGPASLEAGQTYRLPFRAPAELSLSCSAHKDGQITIAVEPAPEPGLARLRWRLSRLPGG